MNGYQCKVGCVAGLICAVFLIPLGISGTAFAQSGTSTCSPGTTVVYGNGVANTLTQAYMSLRRTQAIYEKVLQPRSDERVLFELAFNPSNRFAIDLIESFEQLLSQPVPTSLLLEYVLGRLPPPAQIALLLAGVFGESLQAPQLSKHIALYKERIVQGDRVIVFAHSQGNFFANDAYAGLSSEEKSHFALVSVATPAAIVAGGGPHITLFGDIIWLVPGARPFNTTNDSPPGDWHGYLEYYTPKGTNARFAIEEALFQVSETPFPLESPDCINGRGAIDAATASGFVSALLSDFSESSALAADLNAGAAETDLGVSYVDTASMNYMVDQGAALIVSGQTAVHSRASGSDPQLSGNADAILEGSAHLTVHSDAIMRLESTNYWNRVMAYGETRALCQARTAVRIGTVDGNAIEHLDPVGEFPGGRAEILWDLPLAFMPGTDSETEVLVREGLLRAGVYSIGYRVYTNCVAIFSDPNQGGGVDNSAFLETAFTLTVEFL